MPLPSFLLSSLLLGVSPPASAADTRALRLEVVAPAPNEELRVVASTTWLGEPREVELRDDGRSPDLQAGDGHLVGVMEGAPVRALALRLDVRLRDDDAHRVIWEGIEILHGEDDVLTWSVEDAPAWSLRRVAYARTARSAAFTELGWGMAGLGWLGLGLGVMAWLVGRRDVPGADA